jgi:hypothetical protein
MAGVSLIRARIEATTELLALGSTNTAKILGVVTTGGLEVVVPGLAAGEEPQAATARGSDTTTSRRKVERLTAATT